MSVAGFVWSQSRICNLCRREASVYERRCPSCGAPWPLYEALAYAATQLPLTLRLRPYTMARESAARQWAQRLIHLSRIAP